MELKDYLTILKLLKADKKPLWGKMTPQHMVEHLTDSLNMSNGIQQFPIVTPEDKISKLKAAMLLSDMDFPQMVVSPILPTLPISTRYQELSTAIEELHKAIMKFHEHFSSNPTLLIPNPIFGNLQYEEWQKFHEKHFKHHFKQFALV